MATATQAKSRYEGRRYRLLSAHYTEEDKYLLGDQEADQNDKLPATFTDNENLDSDGNPVVHRGTIVGRGTPHKWTRPPTPDMVGLDPESQALVEEEKRRGDGLNPVDYLPMTYGQSMKDDDDE